MRIRLIITALLAVCALATTVTSAQASTRVNSKTHAAVVQAVVRFAVDWNEGNATGVCSSVTPAWRQAFITELNHINTDNGSPLPTITTCTEAIRRSRFVPRYLSPSQIRTITRTVTRYPAVQVNSNTVSLEEGTYVVVRIHGHWLLNQFAGI
jgi:hypothetical protein